MAKNEALKQVVDGIKFRYKLKTQKDIAELLGYSSVTNISDMLSGRTPISNNFSDKLMEVFKVNPEFLKTQKGNIWIDESSNSNSQIGDYSTSIAGNSNNVNNSATLDKAIKEIAEQRKLIAKSQEQIDRLLSIIEQMNTLHGKY